MSRIMQVEVKTNGIAYLRMQDEANKNIFSEAFIHEFLAALDDLENKYQPKVLILAGLPEVFCGGGEKQNLLDLCDGKILVKDMVLCERLLKTPFPIIAAMTGHAVGGGLMLAVCADIVLAAQESRYGAVFMSLGFTPGMGCTQLLAELVGPYLAAEMMFTAKRFKGRELAGRGTNLNYILPKAEIMAKAENIALQICDKNIKSIYLLKQALSAKKKQLLVSATLQEDYMHRLSFSFPETRATIEELYGK